MNLIPLDQRAGLVSAINDIHDTFSRAITAITNISTPVAGVPDSNDDYDFTNGKAPEAQEFVSSIQSVVVKARVKYLDKEELFSEIPATEVDHLSVRFGIIRLKVALADCNIISGADNIIVDDFNTNVIYRDMRHGLFSNDYCTFYVQRTS